MIQGLDAVVLIVKDLERQKRFYRDVLGLPVEAEAGDAVFLSCGREKLALFARSHHPEGTLSLEGAARGISHLEFRIPREEQELYDRRLREAGLHAYGETYRDPDGNLFHFTFEPAPPAGGDLPARDFDALRGLKGLPDALVAAHVGLYQGYVKNLNLLRRRLREHPPGAPEWAELQRRVGFEINGMRLHELYFENLSPAGGTPSRALAAALAASWGSFEAWRAEFAALGLMRGVGWAILYRDPATGRLSNHWIGLHEEGHPAGFSPILVMDAWEHAFAGMERVRYVDAFLENAGWERAERRLAGAP